MLVGKLQIEKLQRVVWLEEGGGWVDEGAEAWAKGVR